MKYNSYIFSSEELESYQQIKGDKLIYNTTLDVFEVKICMNYFDNDDSWCRYGFSKNNGSFSYYRLICGINEFIDDIENEINYLSINDKVLIKFNCMNCPKDKDMNQTIITLKNYKRFKIYESYEFKEVIRKLQNLAIRENVKFIWGPLD